VSALPDIYGRSENSLLGGSSPSTGITVNDGTQAMRLGIVEPLASWCRLRIGTR
jgi:hypothetical protein